MVYLSKDMSRTPVGAQRSCSILQLYGTFSLTLSNLNHVFFDTALFPTRGPGALRNVPP